MLFIVFFWFLIILRKKKCYWSWSRATRRKISLRFLKFGTDDAFKASLTDLSFHQFVLIFNDSEMFCFWIFNWCICCFCWLEEFIFKNKILSKIFVWKLIYYFSPNENHSLHGIQENFSFFLLIIKRKNVHPANFVSKIEIFSILHIMSDNIRLIFTLMVSFQHL
jgi:hypothetical protein